jgi:hypothetical protein
MRSPLALPLSLLLAWACCTLPLAADPPPEAPGGADPSTSRYGDTYTPDELAALDRALNAGNMTRHDLTFRKDMAKGTGCFPIVREMLRDPLTIAPFMDRRAAALLDGPPGTEVVLRAAIHALAAMWAAGIDDAHDVESAEGLLRVGSWSSEWMEEPAPEALRRSMRAELTLNLERVRLAALPVVARGPGGEPRPELAPEELSVLRRRLPAEMAMHEVGLTPLDPVEASAIEARCAAREPAYVQELAQRLDSSSGPRAAARLWELLAAVQHWPAANLAAFPTDKPWVEETQAGRIAFGTPGDDVYTGDYYVIVDPGGNDRYMHGRFAAATGELNRTVGLVIDLGGDDVYACGDVDVTLGAAVLGAAALFDLGQGDDRYEGGHVSLGAAIGGAGVLYDDGGSDVYEGKSFTQGAAGYGLGLLYDDAVQPAPDISTSEETKDPIDLSRFDNDRLHAWTAAQAFARCRGVALCVNRRGNEVYEAGGVYLHAPLFSDRYQSFSQGFAIGAREHDMAGGIALLVDGAGNDRYLGDIYNQGVGYWYAAGLLYDGGGHDHYEMTQYGQGSGIHLAVGGLIDVAGSDAYVMHSGLGQGGSHDYAASVFHDRGGNDRYHGNTSCNGTGLTNSVGIHIDRAGDDTYASRRDGGFNAGRPARGFGSVGVLLDLGGKDDYLGPPAPGNPQDDGLWRSSDVGLGLDLAPPAPPTPSRGGTPAADQPSRKVEIPAICRDEGPLTQEVFDQLWAISVRWEVGDNRTIVPEARKRLIAYGKEALPYLDQKVEKDESGLEIRAYVDILGGLKTGGAGAEVVEFLSRNLAGGLVAEVGGGPSDRRTDFERLAARQRATDRRQRVALQLVGELKEKDLALEVAKLLTAGVEPLDRRAASVLGQLASKAGSEVLVGWLGKPEDEARVLAALGTLFANGEATFELVLPLLDHPLVTVRTRLATLLAEKKAVYAEAILGAFGTDPAPGQEGLSPRALRTLLDVLVRGNIPPGAAEHVSRWAGHPDWGLRADVARVLSLWVAMAFDPASGLTHPIPTAAAALATLRTDADPYVRACAR